MLDAPMEPMIPFNPTDLFREAIFGTDFMGEQDMGVSIQMLGLAISHNESQEPPLIHNNDDRLPLRQQQTVILEGNENDDVQMTTEGGNVGEGQEAGLGPGPAAARMINTMDGFAFDDEDELDALMQLEQQSQKQVPTTIINTTTSGVGENGDNTKPKEQND